MQFLTAVRRLYVRSGGTQMCFPTFGAAVRRKIRASHDPTRYASLALAIQRIESDGIVGAIAECGVWKGETSSFIHSQAPQRKLYLFDTFSGFPDSSDLRFHETSEQVVRTNIGDCSGVEFRKGVFPETAAGLETLQFALVMLDFDLYAPTLAGLEFFYPRVAKGGFIFLHDFNNPESDWAVSRAATRFLADKLEKLIEIPDMWGSAVLRKT